MEIRTNLQELNAANRAPFDRQELVNLQDITRERELVFSSVKPQEARMDVRLSDIVGHDQMYDALVWGDCLMKGKALKRLERNLEYLKSAPDYYRQLLANAEALSFVKVEDEFYISTGKHRTVILRYLAHFNPEIFGDDPILRNVHITEDRVIDYDYMSLRNQLTDVTDKMGITLHMHYTRRTSDEICATLHSDDFQAGMLSVKRSEIKALVHALERPEWLKKVQGHPFHQHATFLQNTDFASILQFAGRR